MRGTVLDLKLAIQKETGLEPNVQKILFGGRAGNDSSFLEDMRVVDKQKLLLMATEKSVSQQMAQQEKEYKEKLELERQALAEQERQAAERIQKIRQEAALARQIASETEPEIPQSRDLSIEDYQRQRGLLLQSADDGTNPPLMVQVELPLFSSVFSSATAARNMEEHSNKILLPSSVLEKLLSGRCKHPYMFEITKISTDLDAMETDAAGNKVIVSVLDFTSEKEAAFAPHWVVERLGIEQGSVVSLRTVVLETGSFATLQPLQFDWIFIPEEQRRAVLESRMRTYQAISLGEIVSIEHLQKTYKFEIVDLKPAEHVSIVDSDLEVDILPPVDTMKHQHNPLQLSEDHKTTESKVELSKEVPYAFFKIELPDPNMNYSFEVTSDSSTPILFFMDTKRQYPTRSDNQWTSEIMAPTPHTTAQTPSTPGVYTNPRTNSKSIVVNHLDPKFSLGPIHIGVYAAPTFISNAQQDSKLIGKIRIIMEPLSGAGRALNSEGVTPASSSSQEGLVQCDNCLRMVPSATFMMHSAQCARRNWRCKLCNLVVPIEERAQHELNGHAKHKCDQCGEFEAESVELDLHKVYECRNRPFECPYCHLHVPYSQRGTHMRDCGTRTSKCETCGKYFKNSEMQRHLIEAHNQTQDVNMTD